MSMKWAGFILFAVAAAGSPGRSAAAEPPSAEACVDRFAATLEAGNREAALAELAWVLTLSETTGAFGGKPIASLGAETMLLRRLPAGWRIIHIHWSSRAKP